MKDKYCVFTFYSTHLALEFERVLKGKKIEVKLIPVPRQISSSCGLAGRIIEDQVDEIKSICEKKDIEYDNIYKIFNDNKDPDKIE